MVRTDADYIRVAKDFLSQYQIISKECMLDVGAISGPANKQLHEIVDVLSQVPRSRGKFYVEMRYIYGYKIRDICSAEYITHVTYYNHVNPVLAEIGRIVMKSL